MQKSNAPTKLTVAFASGTGAGPVNTVPLTPGATPGTASYQTGFTSVNMEPIASGGVPPFGADFNGRFKAATTAQIWQQSGYMWPFDSTFAGNANIGGYPAGSVLMMGSGKGLWLNQTDNNAQSPDATGSAGWIGLPAAGTYTINTTGGTTTPDPSVLGVTTLLVTGALTSNATIVLPLSAGARWIIANNTSGSYTLTVQGATGSGVSITQGSALTVFTDGTNYYAASANISGQYLPIDGTAVAATKLATPRSFSIGGTGSIITAAAVSFDGTANIQLNASMADGALTIAKTNGLQSALDAKATVVTPNVTNGQAAQNAGMGLTVSYGAVGSLTPAIQLAPSLGANNFSGMTQAGDAGIIFGSANNSGQSFVIAPWVSGGGGLRISGTGNVTVNGQFVCTTFNAVSSDRRLKRNIRKFKARPLHRATRFVSYTLKANGWNGLGAIAQEVRKVAPEHVGEFEQDGKKYLSLNYSGMAYEQATWAAQEVDRMTLRLAKLERDLARAKIAPRKRGFVRRLLEAIW